MQCSLFLIMWKWYIYVFNVSMVYTLCSEICWILHWKCIQKLTRHQYHHNIIRKGKCMNLNDNVIIVWILHIHECQNKTHAKAKWTIHIYISHVLPYCCFKNLYSAGLVKADIVYNQIYSPAEFTAVSHHLQIQYLWI